MATDEKARGPSGSAKGRADMGDKIRAFARLGRPKFLVYSFVFTALGTLAAVAQTHRISWTAWAAALAFAWCTHVMTHYCNEYYDFAADSANPSPTAWTGGSRVLITGILKPAVSLTAAIVLLALGILIANLAFTGVIRIVALVGLALGWFYTATPIRLNYHGLGEIACAAGITIVWPLIAYLQQGARVSASSIAIIAPIFILQTARMSLMNLSDREGDAMVGKRTLASILGATYTVASFIAVQVVAYSWILIMPIIGMISWLTAILLFLTIGMSIAIVRRLLTELHADGEFGGEIPFWASTHIGLVALAATLGVGIEVIISGAPAHIAGWILTSLSVLLLATQIGLALKKQKRPARTNVR